MVVYSEDASGPFINEAKLRPASHIVVVA